jgi:hypothetical protein
MIVRAYQFTGQLFLIIVRISKIYLFHSASSENKRGAQLGPLINNSKIFIDFYCMNLLTVENTATTINKVY